MSSKLYDARIHTHATFNIPITNQERDDGVWECCFGIIIHTGSHVWILGHTDILGAATEAMGVTIVGATEKRACYSMEGCCVMAVPVYLVDQFYTEEESDLKLEAEMRGEGLVN